MNARNLSSRLQHECSYTLGEAGTVNLNPQFRYATHKLCGTVPPDLILYLISALYASCWCVMVLLQFICKVISADIFVCCLDILRKSVCTQYAIKPQLVVDIFPSILLQPHVSQYISIPQSLQAIWLCGAQRRAAWILLLETSFCPQLWFAISSQQPALILLS